jgi:hypothetical protein
LDSTEIIVLPNDKPMLPMVLNVFMIILVNGIHILL